MIRIGLGHTLEGAGGARRGYKPDSGPGLSSGAVSYQLRPVTIAVVVSREDDRGSIDALDPKRTEQEDIEAAKPPSM